MLLLAAFFIMATTSAQQRRLSLTGFNHDVIADPDLNAMPDSLTNGAIDAPPGNVLFVKGYSIDSTPLTGALPVNGSIVSQAGHYFQLQRYDSNNVLQVDHNYSPSGTLMVDSVDQMAYDSLFILATSGSGNASVHYLITFTDSSTQAGSFTVHDWSCGSCTTFAIDSLSRIDRLGGDTSVNQNFALYEYTIAIAGVNLGKPIVSINFSTPNPGNPQASIFAITGFSTALLPVSLVSFNASVRNGEALLQWKTGVQQNSARFIIERAPAASPNAFAKVGSVQAAGGANGSSYSFANTPGLSGTYLYRLSESDEDGSTKILGVRSLTFNGDVKWLVQDLGYQWRLITNNAYTFRLTDMNGKVLQVNTGNGTTSINKPSAKGIYLLQVWQNGNSSTQKLIN